MLQNFADAGKALYRVARKYASKVTLNKKLLFQSTYNLCLSQYYFVHAIDHDYFALLGRQKKIP